MGRHQSCVLVCGGASESGAGADATNKTTHLVVKVVPSLMERSLKT